MLNHPTHLTRRLSIPLLLAVLAITTGCDKKPASTQNQQDQRLTELTREALQQQGRQNEYIASQAKTVAEQSREVTATAKELVEQDALARREVLQATQELQSQVHTERRSLDEQHAHLEAERRQLAEQRQREPLIAAAIQELGLLLACLLPLAVCLAVLRQLRDETGDEKALAGLLVEELTSEQPLILTASVSRIDQQPQRGLPEPPALLADPGTQDTAATG